MYKIKDNVDLKELEKHGFRRLLLLGDGHLPRYIKMKKNITIKICCVYRTINVFNNKMVLNSEKYIKDLIRAGLVEKVVDNESNND